MRFGVATAIVLAAACSQGRGPVPHVETVTPAAVCVTATPPAREVRVLGEGFSPLVADLLTDSPRLELGTATLRRTARLDGTTADDAPLAGVGARWIGLGELVLELPAVGDGELGFYRLELANADGQADTLADAVALVLAPSLVEASPVHVCAGASGVEVTVTGEALVFGPGEAAPTVLLGARSYVAHDPTGCRAVGGGGVSVCTSARVTVAMGDLDDGQSYTVSLQNPGDAGACAVSSSLAIIGGPGGAPMFVDPPFVPADVSLEATVYLDAPDGPPDAVAIQVAGQPATRTSVEFAGVPGHPRRFTATLPAGLQAGAYDLVVIGAGGCEGEMTSAFTVVAGTTLALAGVEPEVGYVGADLGIDVQGTGFAATPWLFVRPVAGGVARRLRAVEFQSATRVDAIVTAGLAAGAHDLIAINPTGEIGVLPGALMLSAAPPPTIAEVQPRSFPAGAQPLAIAGAGFDAPSVQLRCRVDGDGPLQVSTASVDSVSPTSLQVTTAAGLQSGSVCVVRVINANGAAAELSAVFAGDPAGLRAQTDLDDARRAPAAVVAVAGGLGFLYVLGGDAGAPASARDTIEFSRIDPWGRLRNFKRNRSRMTAARSLLGAVRVGDFVYAVGGAGPGAPPASIERAHVLSPDEAPRLSDVDLALGLGPGTGLPGGQWVYRVGARRAPGDLLDPGGETLASEPVTVTLPDRSEGVRVILSWPAVPGAAGYRIYRTGMPGQAVGDERLVAEVGDAVTTFIDTGMAASSERALPLGSLGTWLPVAGLASARQGAAVALAVDPADASRSYLYVAGGLDAAGVARDDYEYFAITGVGAAQLVSPSMPGASAIGGGRWQLPAWVVDAELVPAFAEGETWIYLGGGLDAGGADEASIVAGLVPAGGAIVFTQMTVDTPIGRMPGAGAAAGRGELFLLGGGSGGSAGASRAQVCAGAGGGCSGGPPELRSWAGAGGNTLTVARTLMAVVREGVFVFVAGGAGGGGALRATEGTAL